MLRVSDVSRKKLARSPSSSHAAASWSLRRAVSTTSAPSPYRARAHCRPIPAEAPVINAQCSDLHVLVGPAGIEPATEGL